jgi:hypothetical protein
MVFPLCSPEDRGDKEGKTKRERLKAHRHDLISLPLLIKGMIQFIAMVYTVLQRPKLKEDLPFSAGDSRVSLSQYPTA